MVKPQTITRMSNAENGAPNASGDNAAHVALASIAAAATRALPHWSAQRPASTHPTDPLAMAMKATSEPVPVVARALSDVEAPVLSDVEANAAIQVHIA